ncbi:hypothetical protein KAR91_83400 [Candidatus Pacearchaeota archaeon]|nr:hypothetical protein [Candidatus Pacearchaeota archaeon]
MNRALRRHHKQRIKNKVKYYYGGVHINNPKYIGMASVTRHACSRYCCGNPRKHFNEVTRQEKIHDLAFELDNQ